MRLAQLSCKLLGAAVAVLSTEAVASGQTVWWAASATRLIDGSPNGGVTGVPDGLVSGTTGNGAHRVSNFTLPVSYAGLAGFLGVSPGLLSQADFIGFERNGTAPLGGGWESTHFTFADGINSTIVDLDELTGGASPPSWLLATGSVPGTAYDTYFSPSSSSPPNEVYSWVLFDVPSTFNLADLTVTVEAGSAYGLPGSGTPDPDAYALLVPSPSVLIPGLMSAVIAVGRRRSHSSIMQIHA